MYIEILEHGVMNTDFFGGTGGVWINVPVDNKTTLAEIVESLECEINQIYDHIEYTAEHHCFDLDNLQKEIDNQLESMKEYIKGKEDKVYNPSLEFSFDELDDYDELPQAIFTIEFIKD